MACRALSASDLTWAGIGSLATALWESFTEWALESCWAVKALSESVCVGSGIEASVLSTWAVSSGDGLFRAVVTFWASLTGGLSHLILVRTFIACVHGKKWEAAI